MINNKTFQFLAGCVVIFLSFRLWQEGWIDGYFAVESNDGSVESLDLVAMFISAAVSAVQMVGLVAIGIFQPLIVGLIGQMKSFTTTGDASATTSEIDTSELNRVLTDIATRLTKLESTSNGD